jgi:Flp pilus assembly protein protease CpaA
VSAAAVFDLRSRRIPNALILVGLLLALGAQLVAAGAPGLARGAIGAGAALALLIGPFALRTLGGGDVKLAMVIGAWTGLWMILQVLLISALLAGLISGFYWLFQTFRPTETVPRVPVAVPLCAATILVTGGFISSGFPVP